MYKAPLVSGNIYHVYNRGNDKRKIFMDYRDSSRFLSLVKHYLVYDYSYSRLQIQLRRSHRTGQTTGEEILTQLETNRFKKPLVETLFYCQMPNHYHLVFRQLVDEGISHFMHRLGTGYTNYFNLRYERSGALFEGRFKYVRVRTENQLIYLSAYVHINPTSTGLVGLEELIGYPWSSLAEYFRDDGDDMCNKGPVMHNFGNNDRYLSFIGAFAEGKRPEEMEQIEDVVLDNDFGWFGG